MCFEQVGHAPPGLRKSSQAAHLRHSTVHARTSSTTTPGDKGSGEEWRERPGGRRVKLAGTARRGTVTLSASEVRSLSGSKRAGTSAAGIGGLGSHVPVRKGSRGP